MDGVLHAFDQGRNRHGAAGRGQVDDFCRTRGRCAVVQAQRGAFQPLLCFSVQGDGVLAGVELAHALAQGVVLVAGGLGGGDGLGQLAQPACRVVLVAGAEDAFL